MATQAVCLNGHRQVTCLSFMREKRNINETDNQSSKDRIEIAKGKTRINAFSFYSGKICVM